MALIACPNPNCEHEIVDNWLSCPRCSCPVQVLLAAHAARAEEAAAADLAAAEAGTTTESERIEEVREVFAEAEAEEDDLAPRSPEDPPAPLTGRAAAMQKAGQGSMMIGAALALFAPVSLDNSTVLTLVILSSLSFVGAGVALGKLASTMPSEADTADPF